MGPMFELEPGIPGWRWVRPASNDAVEAASLESNPIRHAMRMAAKIPNWALPPRTKQYQLAQQWSEINHGANSDKSRIGMASEPRYLSLNSHSMILVQKVSFPVPSPRRNICRFTSMAPKPRGRRKARRLFM